jgi:hypothetical protein
VQIAELLNSDPDFESPRVEAMSIEKHSGRVFLKGRIKDASRISGGWLLLKELPGDSSELFIAPWQIEDGSFEVDLTRQSSNGTRRVNEIIFSDEHGNASRLVVCLANKPDCNQSHYEHCVNSKKGNLESCADSGLGVVEYFVEKINR